MRWLGVLVLVVGGATACTGNKVGGGDGGCGGAGECAAGSICINEECVEICRADSDCTEPGTICRNDVCIPGGREDAPIITGIDGNGVVDGVSTHTAHRIDTTLFIFGEHLEGADVVLDDGTNEWDLEICVSQAGQLDVLLPQGLASGGDYTLTVSTQAGACETTLPVLQGQDGAPGADGLPGSPGDTGPQGPMGEAGGGLMLNLEFEEDGGTAPVDSSPFAHTVQVDSSGLAQGSIGHSGDAIAFSGGVVTVPAPNRLADTPQIWIEAWIQAQQPMNTTRTIAIRTGAFALKQADEDLWFSVTGTGSGTACTVATTGAILSAGRWTHVGGWYDGLYAAVTVNGAVFAREPCRVGPVVATSGDFFVGGADASATEPYLGIIDEVRVRHRAPGVGDGRIANGFITSGASEYASQAIPEARLCTDVGCELEWITYDQTGHIARNEIFFVHYLPATELMTVHYVRGGGHWIQFNVADSGGTWWWWWTGAAGMGECYPMDTAGNCTGQDELAIISNNGYASQWALRRRAF